MNWDAIGAIAETLGAVGVIASLVYLAGQVRHSRDQMNQNTRALRAGTYQQWDDSLQGTVMEAATTPLLDSAARLGSRIISSSAKRMRGDLPSGCQV